MTDQELWSRGVTLLQAEFSRLPAELAVPLTGLAGQIRDSKQELFAISAAAHGEALCTDCGGVCCGRGKYHLSTTDLLICLAAGQQLIIPSFTAPLCPYLGEGGCLMSPEFRPLTCVIFICEALEGRLPPSAVARFNTVEAALRDGYRRVDRLFGRRLGGSFLLAVERSLAAIDGRLLAGR